MREEEMGGRQGNQAEQQLRSRIWREIDTYLDQLLGRQGEAREEVIRLIAARIVAAPGASGLAFEQRLRLVREELERLFPAVGQDDC